MVRTKLGPPVIADLSTAPGDSDQRVNIPDREPKQSPAAPAGAATTNRGLTPIRSGQVEAVQHRTALVIGNNIYKNLTPLKTAVADAQAVAAVLRDAYGFDLKLLLNAGRGEILAALNQYRRELPEESALLIYYAGHGYFDSIDRQDS